MIQEYEIMSLYFRLGDIPKLKKYSQKQNVLKHTNHLRNIDTYRGWGLAL